MFYGAGFWNDPEKRKEPFVKGRQMMACCLGNKKTPLVGGGVPLSLK
jgi:hypothetical protein